MSLSLRKKTLSIILAGALAVCGLYICFHSLIYFVQLRQQQVEAGQRKAAWQLLRRELGQKIKQFPGQAAVVVKDLRSGRQISYNRDKLFASASLAKLPIMAACFLADREGRVKLDRRVILKKSDKLSGSGILKNVQPGASFTVEKLIGLMVYESDNTATNILTNLLGVAYLKMTFNVLGLKHTSFSRRVADFNSRNRGIENYTTAQDMAYLLEKIYRGELVSRRASEKCLQLLKLQRVNDRIPKYLPAQAFVAHKTGLERAVCHDVGIIFSCRGDLLICVLTGHANPDAQVAKEFIAQVALDVYTYAN